MLAAANTFKVAPRGGGHFLWGRPGQRRHGADLSLPIINYTGGSHGDAFANGLYAMHQVTAACRGISDRHSPDGWCCECWVIQRQSPHAASDQSTSASVVLPSGQAVTASATDHPDRSCQAVAVAAISGVDTC